MNGHRWQVVLIVVALTAASCSSESTGVGTTVSAPSTAASDTTDVTDTTDGTATTLDANGLDPRLTPQPLTALEAQCVEVGCTGVAVSLGGEIVTYDAATGTLTFLDSGRTVMVDPTISDALTLAIVGPDDVAYMLEMPADAGDPVFALDAIATTGASAGQVVARTGEYLDGSGDSSLIAAADGLMEVPCCGHLDRLPTLDNTPVMPWVLPTGEASGVSIPAVHLEYPNDTETVVVRTEGGTETRWTVPAVLAGRDMPPVVATDDGGALVWMYDEVGAPEVPAVLYDLRPDGTVETYAMGTTYKYVLALNPARFVVVYTDESAVRFDLP